MQLRKLLFRLFAVILILASASCAPPPESAPGWQELFNLVQSGKTTAGKVIAYRAPHDKHPYVYLTPDLVEVQIEVMAGDGSVQTFWELWPIRDKKDFPEGASIEVYEFAENKTIPRASKTLLRAQKLLQ